MRQRVLLIVATTVTGMALAGYISGPGLGFGSLGTTVRASRGGDQVAEATINNHAALIWSVADLRRRANNSAEHSRAMLQTMERSKSGA